MAFSSLIRCRRRLATARADFAGGLPQTQAAIDYAKRMHAGQQRADGTPFILHPLEVATILYDAGAPDHFITAVPSTT